MRGLRFLAFLGGFSAFLSLIPAEACLTVPVPSPPVVSSPISIKSDADFLTNPAVRGGSGTTDDPYRIEDIELTVKASPGIQISGTTAPFFIRNVTVRDPSDPRSRSTCCMPAIALAGLQNGRVEGVRVEGAQIGLSLSSVSGVSVVGTAFVDGKPGLSIRESTGITLAGNRFMNSSISFEASTPGQAGSHTISPDNIIDGLPLLYYGNCSAVSLAGQTAAAVIVGNCAGVSLTRMVLPRAGGSLQILHSSAVAIEGLDGGALTFANVSGTSLRNSTFTNVSVSGFDGFVVESSRTAAGGTTWIVASAGTGLRIQGNEFHGRSNLLTLGGYSGQWCYCLGPPPPMAVASATVTNNTLEGTGGTAVQLGEAPSALLVGNRIQNYSIAVDAGAQPAVVIEDNLITAQGGTAIRATGEGTAIRNNTIQGFDNGLELGPAVEATGNEIEAMRLGITLTEAGGPYVSGNRLVGGAIVPSWSYDSTALSFSLGPNNTVNGLPVAFHRACLDLRYEGVALGQLIVVDCENVTLANLSFRDVSFPVLLSAITNLSIEGLEVENASLGIGLRGIWVGRLAHSRLNNTNGVDLNGALNVTLEANVLTNGTAGFRVSTAAGVEFLGNRVGSLGQPPLALYQAYELKLRGNEFVGGGLDFYGAAGEEIGFYDIDGSNTVDGEPLMYVRDLVGSSFENLTLGELIIANCTGTRVANIEVRSGGPGIILAFVAEIALSNVTVNSSRSTAFAGWYVEGLTLEDSAVSSGSAAPSAYGYGVGALTFANAVNVTVERTNATGSGNYPGLQVDTGSQLTVRGGAFRGGWFGAGLHRLSTVHIDGAQFWGTYGGLEASDLVNATITSSSFSGGGGLWLERLRDSRVEGNDLSGASFSALGISDASRVALASNRMHDSAVGVSLTGFLQDVTVERNTLEGNGEGIYLDLRGGRPSPVSGVSIVNNTVEGNDIGVRGNASAGVSLYHNRFLNNTVQARVSQGAAWDAGYLVGGNFWSDYVGKDACSGPNQDVCPDPDEFGDTPYCLGAPPGVSEAVDRFPLMNQTPPPARDPPPYVERPPPPPVPGMLDPTAAAVSGIALLLGVIGTAALFAAHARSRKAGDDADDEDGPRGPSI